MKLRILTALIIVVVFGRCKDDDAVILISAEAKVYLNAIIDIMEQHSINKDVIDWTAFRTKVLAVVPQAQTIADTYPAIREALKMLGDNHSFLSSPGGGTISASTLNCSAPTFISPTLPDNIGYVRVQQFSSSSNKDNVSFASAIQDKIKNQDSDDLLGWIVDLRSNHGGNMWPMLAGIGPILGDGIAGYFAYPNGDKYPWSYADGASKIGENAVTTVGDPYVLLVPNPKVAVLLDNGVASSGEAIAVSFIGRDNTRSFGRATCGLSTSNEGFALSDKAILILTTSYLADRDMNKFGVPIIPEVIADNNTIIEEAVDWIQN